MVEIRNRTLVLSDKINSDTVGKIMLEIVELATQDEKEEKSKLDYKREPIHLIINSSGGEVPSAFGLIDLIQSCKTPIYTYSYGISASCGFLILIAGAKRFMSRNSSVMCHAMKMYLGWSTYKDIERVCNDNNIHKIWETRLNNHIVKNTKITLRELKNNDANDNNWWFSADEAKNTI